jgi:hypothetical protein
MCKESRHFSVALLKKQYSIVIDDADVGNQLNYEFVSRIFGKKRNHIFF